MMNAWRRLVSALAAIFILLSTCFSPVSAARGIPGSPEFGIGARLSLTTPGLSDALLTVKNLRLDWLSIDFTWSVFQPEETLQIDFNRLDQAIEVARQNHVAVLLTITNPPEWAMGEYGPDPGAAVQLVKQLTSRYRGTVHAFELFPAPNTRAGWGAKPDARQYLNLYKRVSGELAALDKTIHLVTGSLDVSAVPDGQDLSDIVFLRALYASESGVNFAIIGLRFPSIIGSPADPVQNQTSIVLRHYEDIRELVKSNGNAASLIWITYMDFSEKISQDRQSDYLSKAYMQIRSQLYIGSAFLQGINTCGNFPQNCPEVSLRGADGALHPFYPALRSLLQQNAPALALDAPGRPKSDIFKKFRKP